MFDNVYANKKILITGNTGFKGSWLTIWMIKLGAQVFGLSNNIPTNPSMFENLCLGEKILHFTTDIKDLKSVINVIDKIKPDFLFHFAAQSLVSLSYIDPIDTVSVNVLGTANILEALRVVNNKCVGVIITSDKCYDNVEWAWGYKETDTLGGKDVYSGSKGAAELIIKSYYHSFFNKNESNIKIVSARAGNVIGGGDWADNRIVPDCVRSWNKGEIVDIRNPDAVRPWQHVLEPLSGYLALGMELFNGINLNGESFNFGPLSQYCKTVMNLIDQLGKYWNSDSCSNQYRITGNNKFYESGLLKLNCDKALMLLNWMPSLDFDKLIEFTGNWYLKFYKNEEDMFQYTLKQIDEYQDIASAKEIRWAVK